jgi:hypothetical protein
MLNENTIRTLKPAQVASIMPWESCEGVVILCLGAKGEANNIVMSTVTIEELALLTAQLQAHLNSLLFNSLVEDVPTKKVEAANGPDAKD